MSRIIELLLKEREEIIFKIDEATASLKEELNQANSALILLGHKFDNPFISASYSFDSPEKKNPTIKERVTQALTERYPDGAHYSDILNYINLTWPHLLVKRTSLSPQLTRLRQKGVIFLDDGDGKGIWHLADDREAINESTPEVGAEGNATTLL